MRMIWVLLEGHQFSSVNRYDRDDRTGSGGAVTARLSTGGCRMKLRKMPERPDEVGRCRKRPVRPEEAGEAGRGR
jgi:hypothetical protein